MADRKYQNLKEYLDFVKANYRKTKTIRAGYFVSFNYLFHLNPDYKEHPERKKYLDFFPMDLVLWVNYDKKLFLSVNFHAFPVATRQILMARLRRVYESTIDRPRSRIPGINYRKMLRFLKKLGVAIRKYHFSRVRNYAEIPGELLDESMKFYANTFYKTNYLGVVSRYNNFKPKPRT